MTNILIADSIGSSREELKSAVGLSDCNFIEATDGKTAVELCRKKHIDIILSDVMLPLLDGFSFCKQIRDFSNVPFIFVSTKCDDNSKIKAFESGADDYVCRPFCKRELALRIEALLKRCNVSFTEDNSQHIHNLGKLSIDTASCTVTVANSPLKLRKKEYELLTLFAENKGKVLPRESIIDTIWHDKPESSGRVLDSHIKNLRKQLGECGDMITTFHGIGYKFDCQ